MKAAEEEQADVQPMNMSDWGCNGFTTGFNAPGTCMNSNERSRPALKMSKKVKQHVQTDPGKRELLLADCNQRFTL